MLQKRYFIKLFLIAFSLGVIFSADNDAAFGDILLHHVTNDNSYVYIPIEIGGLDLSITKHVILIFTIGVLTTVLAIFATSKYKNNNHRVPSKFSGLFEILVDFINKDMVVPNIGKKQTSII